MVKNAMNGSKKMEAQWKQGKLKQSRLSVN